MDVYECIKTRRTIRKYIERPVEWEKVGRIMDAGKSAPCAGNIQNWKFIVVTDGAMRKKFAEVCDQLWMAQAPVHIVVMNDFSKLERMYGIRGERLYSVQNCAAAVENMLLMAHALDLGGCWVGHFDEETVKSLMNIPDFARPQAIVTVGYADEAPPTPPKFTMENVMFFRQYGGQPERIKDIPQYKGEFAYKIKDAIDKGKGMIDKINKKLQKKDEK